MSRELASGTPARTSRYLHPGGGRPVVPWALIGTGVVVLVFAILFAAGQRRFITPGSVSSAHAPINRRCAQCHNVGHAVDDLRCERCHDPAGTDRLRQSGHVLFGSGDQAKADAAEPVACILCHTDHLGNTVLVGRVDDRECGHCHRFSSLGRHPEFAIVRAGIATGIGLRFNHDRHLVEVNKIGGRRCETCHEPTADLTRFEPIGFDKHCASCHTTEARVTGETDPLSPALLVAASQIAEPWAASSTNVPTVTSVARGSVVVSRMRHRDPWVLHNARRMRRMIDPNGERVEQTALRTQVAYLEGQRDVEPLSSVAGADLERWRVALEQNLAAIDRALAGAPGSNASAQALRDLSSAMSALVEPIAAVDPERGASIQDLASPPSLDAAAVPTEPVEALRRRFDERKTELATLLDAIAQRGDAQVAARARTLRGRVDLLQPETTDTAADAGALGDALQGLDDIFRAIRTVPDPQAAFDAAQAAALRDAASQQITGGLSIDQFEDRRRELLEILDAVDRRGNDLLRGRVGVLRQQVLALRPGGGDAGLWRTRARMAKTLERVRLEMALTASGETAAPAAAAPPRDRRAIQAVLDRLREQLMFLSSGSHPGILDNPDERGAAVATLTGLLGPCLKCHVMDSARLAPVSAAKTVFQHATFTHKPHVGQVDCLTCHAPIPASKQATDLVVPNVATCRQCHSSSRARSDCQACHTYHPPSVAGLMGGR